MRRKKLKDLLDILKKEEKLARKRADEAKLATNEVAKTSRTSWSAAGERNYAQGQAQILSEYDKRILKLRQDVEKAVVKEAPGAIEDSSFVKVVINAHIEELFLVNNPINLSKIKLVSSGSALGKALLGKRVEDHFFFDAEGGTVEGKVIYIE